MRGSIPVLLTLLAVATPVTGQSNDRIPPRPLTEPPAFRSALENGTRSPDGRPGRAYWQQRVDYDIEASLSASGRVAGRQTIRYTNNSPDVLSNLLLHLDQNVFREGARRNRRAPITGGIEVTDIRVDGRPATAGHPGRRYYESLTLLRVELPEPLASGATAELAMEWSFTVPPAPTFRTGNLDDRVFAVAQWYPRAAVYDDVYGWNEAPYLGDGEFYLEYGDFDVRLTVPAGWLVGATGTLQNPAEVVGAEAAARLSGATRSNRIVRIAEATPRPGTSTWHFTAENVRDFAFSASPEYVWEAAGTADGKLGQALYRPRGNAGWTHIAGVAAHTIESLSELIGPYEYPQLTITEGPVGGMEYPMVVFNPSSSSPGGGTGVTIHEGSHQWFPMMVGSMEAKHAWMDEGFVTYWQAFVRAALDRTEVDGFGGNGQYQDNAGREREVSIMRHTDLVSPYGERSLAAYRKPAVVLGALRETVGDEAFVAAFRDYFASWKFRHPQPWGFFNLVEEHVGEDLDWFWRPLMFETAVLDHAIGSVTVAGGTTSIEVLDRGDVLLPTHIVVRMRDGSTVERRITAREWLQNGMSTVVRVPGRARSVVLDPDIEMPDVDRSNNRWGG